MLRRIATSLSLLALSAGMAGAAPAKPEPRPAAKKEASAKPAAKAPQKKAAKPAAKPAVKAAVKAEPKPPAMMAKPLPAPSTAAAAPEPTTTGAILRDAGETMTAAKGEAGLVKEALARLQAGDLSGTNAIRDQVREPAARVLIEWLTIRNASRQVGFDRIAAFLREHGTFPGVSLIRRRAEEALFLESASPATIKSFFATGPAISALGRLAMARVALAESRNDDAQRQVRTAWRDDDLSAEIETKVLSEFGRFITAEDHAFRAERLFYDGKSEAGLRAAERAGDAYQSLARARLAVAKRAGNAEASLNAVSWSAKRLPGFRFTQIQHLRRAERVKEAAALMLDAPRDPSVLVDPHEWWVERRVLARELLDLNDPRTAYRIVAEHAATAPADIADAEFHAGWIALRFLNNPQQAAQHFAVIPDLGSSPMTRSRGYYWLGRAEEAKGNDGAARRNYEQAAQFGTFYYGQLARARIGLGDLPVRHATSVSPSARATFARNPAVRAIELLYAAGAREEAIPLFSDLALRAADRETYVLLADLAERNRDARSLLIVGKTAVQNGHPLEALAWPTNGIPNFRKLGPAVETAVVHAIARQESAFNPKAVSGVGARGLLQLMPATAAKTARNVGVPFAAGKLTSDAAYNATLGAAHLGELVEDFRGSYIMTFAAYNAGASRVNQWVQRYGDPRSGQVDPIDWVERIPFTETRNYVQRVMENVQVYRARFNQRAPLTIEADLRRGGSTVQ